MPILMFRKCDNEVFNDVIEDFLTKNSKATFHF